MTSEFDFSQVLDVVQSLGLWSIFAWLYLQEKKAHQTTREQYREDLREIANLRSHLKPIHTNDRQAVSE